ncbi:hypothetical protein ACFV1L_21975 [Kitasatospora sp. NPDC059646]|uniref:hypothetical protein n=1 Tax=Kitasatospora sp. NPDC059646 TaxID=3346893 RepID=UPI00367EBA26
MTRPAATGAAPQQSGPPCRTRAEAIDWTRDRLREQQRAMEIRDWSLVRAIGLEIITRLDNVSRRPSPLEQELSP